MKKYQLIVAGLLMAGLTACDDAPITALPQENPQGPVLEGITGTTATASATMTAGINLETLDPETTPVLTLYSLGAGSSELEQSQLSGIMQISNSDLFGEYIELKPVDGVQGTVSTADLNEAYVQLFGRAPQTSTAYWRVAMYATINGTAYRVGSTDYYGGSGTFSITAPNPGFEILERYYIIGTPNNWSATQEAIGQCPFTHSDKSPYDDPTFSYSWTAEETYWLKIVPGDLYDEMGNPGFDANSFWDLLIGTAVNDDDSKSGDLVSFDMLGYQAGAMMIAPGNWTLTINMETWTYTITGVAFGGEVPAWSDADMYFRGGFTDDWGAYPEYQFVLTSTDDTYLCPMVSIPSDINFKIADMSWGTFNYGVGDGALAFGTPYEMVYNAGDIAIPGAFNGWAVVEVIGSQDKAMLTMNLFEPATAGEATGIFLRGGMNDWGTGSEWEFQTTEYENVYVIENVSISGGTEFKVADEGWSSINYGATDGATLTFGAPYALEYNAGNVTMAEDFNGTVKLVYNAVYDHYFLYFIRN